MRTAILGTGRATPSRVLTNADLERMVDTSDAWIVERTGIRERRLLEDGRVTSDLAAEAGRQALQAAGLSPADVDCIVVATVTPDMPLPSCACFVQQKIAAARAAAFDLAAACAGFIYGLSIGDAFIRNGQFRHVLVIGVEVLSRVVDWTDRNTCVLFGDAAGAVLLGPSPDGQRGILSTHLFADGSAWESLNIPAGGTRRPASHESVDAREHFIKMNGREVYRVAVRNIAEASRAAMAANGVSPAEVDWVVAHQANLRILEGVSARCGLPMSRFYLNIDRYGNTSSASIPVALDEAVRNGKVRPGQLVLMSALGAGIAWGSALVRW